MTDKKAEEAVLDNHCGEISFSRLSSSFLSYLDVQRRVRWPFFLCTSLDGPLPISINSLNFPSANKSDFESVSGI